LVNVDVDDRALAEAELDDLAFSEALDSEVNAALGTAAEIIKQWLAFYTPGGKDYMGPMSRRGSTGLTAASWEVVAVDRDEYFITNTNEPIITYLIEGTAAHWIYPAWAQALHWVDESGVDHFSKGHEVSGIVGTDIEGLAMEAAQPELDELFNAAIDAAERDVY
jgi:hypothetical protein